MSPAHARHITGPAREVAPTMAFAPTTSRGHARTTTRSTGPTAPSTAPSPTSATSDVSYKIAVLPGDGIGAEITAPTVEILLSLGDFEFTEHPFGGGSIGAHGTALTDEVLEACKASDAVLLAAVGGPKCDTTDPNAPRPEQGLLGLRKELGLYAKLRPVEVFDALADASALKNVTGIDLRVVRELTGGLYFGKKARATDRATDECVDTREEVERIAQVAFTVVEKRVASVDEANVLETSRLWREVVIDVHQREFPAIELEHQLVDSCAMKLVSALRPLEVILTENTFGDILSGEAAMLTGSLGMVPTASSGNPGGPGVLEPVHGAAPEIAGQGLANPLAMILSAALMLRHEFAMHDEAAALELPVDRALTAGLCIPDRGAGPRGRKPSERSATSSKEPQEACV
jgi:3-isopropylmalate dehydrogenase